MYIIDGRGSELSLLLFSKKTVFTSKHNMETTKSEKLLKKTKKKKLGGFFSISRHPRKGVVQGFPDTYFQKFF